MISTFNKYAKYRRETDPNGRGGEKKKWLEICQMCYNNFVIIYINYLIFLLKYITYL